MINGTRLELGTGLLIYRKKTVVVKRMIVQELPKENNVEPGWKPEKGKINLVWDMLYSRRKITTR